MSGVLVHDKILGQKRAGRNNHVINLLEKTGATYNIHKRHKKRIVVTKTV